MKDGLTSDSLAIISILMTITRIIGLEPTSTNNAGMTGSLDKPSISSWELSTDTITDNVDIYELTEIILKQLEPAKDKILQVIKSHN